MLEVTTACDAFRDDLHRHLERDLDLVEQARFLGHIATCTGCRNTVLQLNQHIQAHRILAAGGQMDSESARQLRQAVPAEFRLISERVIRKRARELGRLKFQILQAYLKHLFAEHAWPPVLGEAELATARSAGQSILDNLERYKESSVIMADGGTVDLRTVRLLMDPDPSETNDLREQLRMCGLGLITVRALNPDLDEYVLQLLGAVLERLGHYVEARRMFLAVAAIESRERPGLRAKALSSAAYTCFRYLGSFAEARQYLQEATELYPNRWTIELNFVQYYLWPENPFRDLTEAARWWTACRAHVPDPGLLQHHLLHDDVCQKLLLDNGLLGPQA